MKLKSVWVVLIALVFLVAVGCREKAGETGTAKPGIKTQEQSVKGKEAREEKEGEEAAGEQGKAEEAELPEAVEKAVRDNAPGAEIGRLTVEKEGGIALYDIEFEAGKGEIEVAEDGTVMDVATIVPMTDLPQAAAEAIRKVAGDGTIRQVEKSEVRAEIKIEGGKGTILKLQAPKYVYEAELRKGEERGEVEVGSDGAIVEGPKWETEEAGEKGRMSEKEEAEEAEEAAPKVDLGILPAPVLQAFKEAYPMAVIKGTSKETEKGVTYYEIESVDGAARRDLLYTADGKVAEVEESIAPGALPAAVLAALGRTYPGYEIVKAEKLTKDGRMFYELQIKARGKLTGVTVDPEGNIEK
jgi:hypothetical protein